MVRWPAPWAWRLLRSEFSVPERTNRQDFRNIGNSYGLKESLIRLVIVTVVNELDRRMQPFAKPLQPLFVLECSWKCSSEGHGKHVMSYRVALRNHHLIEYSTYGIFGNPTF